MGLKNLLVDKPYWLRGGLIGVWVWIVLVTLFYLNVFVINNEGVSFFRFTLFFMSFFVPIWGLGGWIISLFLPLLVYFIVGALIGYIIGALKSKNA